jgi:hypothetical protein
MTTNRLAKPANCPVRQQPPTPAAIRLGHRHRRLVFAEPPHVLRQHIVTIAFLDGRQVGYLRLRYWL